MTAPDVIVMGEPLIELTAAVGLAEATRLDLGVSGDAVNAAAAATAAGARVALLACVGDDELGERILRFCADRGIDTSRVRRVDAPNGVYFAVADREGARDFVYLRQGSAGSRLAPADVDAAGAAGGWLLVSGVTHALSPSAAAAVEHAARGAAAAGRSVIYDPNFRRRLTSVAGARAALEAVAPHAALVMPSCPAESRALLGTGDPVEAAAACLALGARTAVVTCGADGVVVDAGDGPVHVPAAPARSIVDATGAGDVLAGTVAARLALGDELLEAVALGTAASALSLVGRGGTGHVPALEQTRAHLATANRMPT